MRPFVHINFAFQTHNLSYFTDHIKRVRSCPVSQFLQVFPKVAAEDKRELFTACFQISYIDLPFIFRNSDYILQPILTEQIIVLYFRNTIESHFYHGHCNNELLHIGQVHDHILRLFLIPPDLLNELFLLLHLNHMEQ